MLISVELAAQKFEISLRTLYSDPKYIPFIKKHENKQLFIIYISNYEEYMIDVFDSNVLGFIPKIKIDNLLVSKIEFARQKIQNMNRIILSIIGGKIEIRENEYA